MVVLFFYAMRKKIVYGHAESGVLKSYEWFLYKRFEYTSIDE